MLQATSGVDTLGYYSLEIFAQADVQINEYILNILLQSAFVAALVISTPLMKKVNRRTHYLASGVAVAVFAFLLSFCIHCAKQSAYTFGDMLRTSQPVVTILMAGAFAVGVGPIPFTLAGELFPAEAKGVCSSLAMSFRYPWRRVS